MNLSQLFKSRANNFWLVWWTALIIKLWSKRLWILVHTSDFRSCIFTAYALSFPSIMNYISLINYSLTYSYHRLELQNACTQKKSRTLSDIHNNVAGLHKVLVLYWQKQSKGEFLKSADPNGDTPYINIYKLCSRIEAFAAPRAMGFWAIWSEMGYRFWKFSLKYGMF